MPPSSLSNANLMNINVSPLTRRKFLGASGAAAVALVAAHRCLGQEHANAPPAATAKNMHPRILSLELLTSAPLARMKQFYHQALGLRVVDERADRLTLAAGLTQLTFVSAGPEAGNPFYHFAFNIPENQIVEALKWQKTHSAMIPVPEDLRDSKYPVEVVNYRHWNAHSIFFFDPAQNVVEYIARHDLENARTGAFDRRDILYASEIAFVVDDVPGTASKLGEAAGMTLYGRGSDVFTALGDERGLLLVMKRGRVISLASPQKKEAAVYRTAASVHAAHQRKHVISGFPYEVAIET